MGMALPVGGGIGGLVLLLLFSALTGTNPLDLISTQQEPSSVGTTGVRDNDPQAKFVSVVLRDTEDTWGEIFRRRGDSYQPPTLVLFTQATQTGCGNASAEVGPFYCPADQEIYFELGFLDQLQAQFGAEGEFAQAYIAAHEFGHHLQTLLGTERQVRAAQQRDPDNANDYSVALELQADCYAGVWSKLADQRSQGGIALTQDNIAEAVNAAEAVGDDRILKRTQGRVDPESWTHGSAEQRRDWFLKGAQSGNMDACNTFR